MHVETATCGCGSVKGPQCAGLGPTRTAATDSMNVNMWRIVNRKLKKDVKNLL